MSGENDLATVDISINKSRELDAPPAIHAARSGDPTVLAYPNRPVGTGRGRQSVVSVTSDDLRQTDTAQEILKPRVGSERIEGWPQQD